MPLIGIHSLEPSGYVLGLHLCGSDLNVDNTRLATLSASCGMVLQEVVVVARVDTYMIRTNEKAQGVTCLTAAEGYILGAKLYPAQECSWLECG